MSTSSGDHDVLLARATALLAVLVVVVIALQGCAGADPAPRSDDHTGATGTPASASSPTATASPPATGSPGPAPYRLPRFRPADHEDWATRIPDELRLDAHLPEDGGDFDRDDRGVAMELCGSPAFPPGTEVDRRTVSASGPEYGEARDLRLFPDDRAAHRFVAAVHAVVAGCPDEEAQGGTWRNEVRRSWLDADESFTAVQAYFTFDGLPVLGASFWEVARVGNAVLLTATGGEFDAATTLDRGIRRHAAEAAEVVDAMCVFAAGRCGRAPVPGSSTHPTVVGPHGLGNIALGASAREVEAFGGRVTSQRTGSGCRIVELWVNDGPDLVGNLEPGLGLSVIYVRTEARTDRSVGTGSPYAEVLAAYPRGEGDRQLFSAPVPGYDDRHWRFWFDRSGRVDEFMLLLDAQHCGG